MLLSFQAAHIPFGDVKAGYMEGVSDDMINKDFLKDIKNDIYVSIFKKCEMYAGGYYFLLFVPLIKYIILSSSCIGNYITHSNFFFTIIFNFLLYL